MQSPFTFQSRHNSELKHVSVTKHNRRRLCRMSASAVCCLVGVEGTIVLGNNNSACVSSNTWLSETSTSTVDLYGRIVKKMTQMNLQVV